MTLEKTTPDSALDDKISPDIKALRYSVIREMGAMAQGLTDVISLGIGEPDFDTPASIIDQALEDTRNGHTHYTQSQGDPELLEALSRNLSREIKTPIPAASILVTHGAMGSLTAAFRTLLEPDDQVILIEPYFPDYLAHITLAKGQICPVPANIEDGFVPRPEAIEKAITPRTKIILLNSPNNPTGAVIPGDVLDKIAKIAIRHDLLVISDEVYDKIFFNAPPESIYTREGMDQRTLVIKSFSKTYAMTGWRLGYCFGPQAIISQMLKVVNYSTACATSISQRAAIAALDVDPEILTAMRDRFAARVELVCSRLAKMPGVKLVRPQGSFYIFADLSLITSQSRDFAIQLIRDQHLTVVPGYAFGASCNGCIRIACTIGQKQLAVAMDRLAAFISTYREAAPA
jgi:aspartate/methionine/tyrosine aminotransferase